MELQRATVTSGPYHARVNSISRKKLQRKLNRKISNKIQPIYYVKTPTPNGVNNNISVLNIKNQFPQQEKRSLTFNQMCRFLLMVVILVLLGAFGATIALRQKPRITTTTTTTTSTTDTTSTSSTSTTSTSTTTTTSTTSVTTTTTNTTTTTSITTTTTTCASSTDGIQRVYQTNNISTSSLSIQTFSYTAAFSSSGSLTLSFQFSANPSWVWYLNDVSIKDTTTGSNTNLLLNGDFQSSSLSPWSSNISSGNIATSYNCNTVPSFSPSDCFQDNTQVPSSNILSQSFSVIACHTYTITYDLMVDDTTSCIVFCTPPPSTQTIAIVSIN